MYAQINDFFICLRKGDFAKLCTTLERELDSEALGVPKIEEKLKGNHAKKMLGNMMKIMKNDIKMTSKWEPKSMQNLKKSEKRHIKNDAEI